MKLNFLGKAAIATAGLYAASKLLEQSEEAQPVRRLPPPLPARSGLQLLKTLEDSFFGGAEYECIRFAAYANEWVMFNEEVDKSVVRNATYQERCNLWNHIRS